MHRIGRRLGSAHSGVCGVTVGILPFRYWGSNIAPLTGGWTVSGGQFDWGGRLRKSNGGAQRYPQNGWKPFKECKGRRVPDCESDNSSRDESRA